MMNRIKKAFLGLGCGLITGAVILGVGGRLVMSAITLWTGGTPAWSLGGSLEVIVFGAILGAVAGLVYGLVMSYVPGSRLVKGLLVGILLVGVMVLIRPPSARSAMTGVDHLLLPILLMFGGIALAFGMALAISVDALSKHVEHTNRG